MTAFLENLVEMKIFFSNICYSVMAHQDCNSKGEDADIQFCLTYLFDDASL